MYNALTDRQTDRQTCLRLVTGSFPCAPMVGVLYPYVGKPELLFACAERSPVFCAFLGAEFRVRPE